MEFNRPGPNGPPASLAPSSPPAAIIEPSKPGFDQQRRKRAPVNVHIGDHAPAIPAPLRIAYGDHGRPRNGGFHERGCGPARPPFGQERIWPDFVALGGGTAHRPHLLVFETKGRHLDNPDTAYKRRVLEALEGAFNCGTMTVRDGPAQGVFRLVFDEAEFPAALAGLDEAG